MRLPLSIVLAAALAVCAPSPAAARLQWNHTAPEFVHTSTELAGHSDWNLGNVSSVLGTVNWHRRATSSVAPPSHSAFGSYSFMPGGVPSSSVPFVAQIWIVVHTVRAASPASGADMPYTFETGDANRTSAGSIVRVGTTAQQWPNKVPLGRTGTTPRSSVPVTVRATVTAHVAHYDATLNQTRWRLVYLALTRQGDLDVSPLITYKTDLTGTATGPVTVRQENPPSPSTRTATRNASLSWLYNAHSAGTGQFELVSSSTMVYTFDKATFDAVESWMGGATIVEPPTQAPPPAPDPAPVELLPPGLPWSVETTTGPIGEWLTSTVGSITLPLQDLAAGMLWWLDELSRWGE